MPQLAVETFFNQLFWLLLVFVCMHTFVVLEVIPNISVTLKSRKSSAESGSAVEGSSIGSKRDSILMKGLNA